MMPVETVTGEWLVRLRGITRTELQTTQLLWWKYMNEPIILESNQNHATITDNGVCPTLPASMGMGGGYVPMVVIEDDGDLHRSTGWQGEC